MATMSAKQRKPTAGFVNDAAALNCMQPSPHTEPFPHERSPYTMASHSSKTNFIGDSIIADGPRAVAVDGAGERHSIILEDEILQTPTNPFSNTPGYYATKAERHHPASASQVNNVSSGDRTRTCCSKRSKATRRHINQKQRLIFTPRNVERQVSIHHHHPDFRPRLQLYNATTQTDVKSSITTQTAVHRALSMSQPVSNLKAQNRSTPAIPSQPPPVKLTRRYMRESAGDMLDSPRRPLRILPREKTAIKHFAELRNIASALTLITVVSWLFSIFFELEGIVDMFGNLLHSLQIWYTKKEKPMTKAEMIFDYVWNFWSG